MGRKRADDPCFNVAEPLLASPGACEDPQELKTVLSTTRIGSCLHPRERIASIHELPRGLVFSEVQVSSQASSFARVGWTLSLHGLSLLGDY